MNMHSSSLTIRGALANEFSRLRAQALRGAFLAKLRGQDAKLASFPQETTQRSPNRKFLGIKDIPVEDIIGTLGRHTDFDHRFRPLKLNLRDRWVNVYLTYDQEGWAPILVHKVGDHYYVEDGHHRVSIARAREIAFIQATIWEYPACTPPVATCESVECKGRYSARKYVTALE